jgi:hypothetical protein
LTLARDDINKTLVDSHKAIPDIEVHQIANLLKLFQLQARTVVENYPHPFIVNGIGPFGAVKVSDRDMHQQVAQRPGKARMHNTE